MYTPIYSSKFNKSYKKLRRSGKVFRPEMEAVVQLLIRGTVLPIKYRDHALTGEYNGFRECHIKPDLLLIYKIEKDTLILLLTDIGSHASLFG